MVGILKREEGVMEFKVGDVVQYSCNNNFETIVNIRADGYIKGRYNGSGLVSGIYCAPGEYRLIKRGNGGSMSKYDEKTAQAIKDSIEHHEDNLYKLKTLDGVLNYNTHSFRIGGEKIRFDNFSCALCKLLPDDCNDCPLYKAGFGCNEDDSVWNKLRKAITKEEAIKAEEEMVRVLKGLLEEEVEMFKIGDRVEVIKERYAGEIGGIIKIDKSDVSYRIQFDNGDIWWEKGENIRKIEGFMSKYDNLKNRIDKVTCWGKEADDILQEIIGDGMQCISIPCDNKDAQITIHQGRRGTAKIGDTTISPLLAFFHYNSQYKKLSAFKKTLLWLLDHSDIKQSLVGSEIKTEIESKVYKVKVLSEV